jgi:hypothetical protein
VRTTLNTFVICLLAVVMNSHSQTTPSNSPAGLFGFEVGGNTMGVLNFDSAGNVTGSYVSVGQPAQTGILTGKYTTNANGIGSLNISVDNGNGNSTIAVVITDGGSKLLLLETSNDDHGGDNGGGNNGGNGGGNNGGGNNGNNPSGCGRSPKNGVAWRQ